ncbi:MAG TPA: hypothetical protein VGY53_04765 [Isosphaeraceae bacterium]|jgi:hypothetical protein|nr:hypothetical protein [Isosphaeraceae bacterium]
MNQKVSDPVIEEVREIRRQISARVGHDPARLVAYYIDLQRQYKERLIGAPEAGAIEGPPGANSGQTPRSCHGPGT